jgi:hypothetical protein
VVLRPERERAARVEPAVIVVDDEGEESSILAHLVEVLE